MVRFLKISVLLFLAIFSNIAFSSSGIIETNTGEILIENDEKKSIKKLSIEVKELEENKRQNNVIIYETKTKLELNDFLKEELTKSEKDIIRDLLNRYNKIKDNLDYKLEKESEQLEETSKIKENIIENKKDIYKKLVPYVKKDKMDEYIEFIKIDVAVQIENTEIKDSTIKKTAILNEKVETIKEKIEEHNKVLGEKIRKAVEQKVEEKINKVINNENFKKLDIELKKKLINSMIVKTKKQVEELENIENKTSVLQRRIEIYDIVLHKLEDLLLSFNINE